MKKIGISVGKNVVNRNIIKGYLRKIQKEVEDKIGNIYSHKIYFYNVSSKPSMVLKEILASYGNIDVSVIENEKKMPDMDLSLFISIHDGSRDSVNYEEYCKANKIPCYKFFYQGYRSLDELSFFEKVKRFFVRLFLK